MQNFMKDRYGADELTTTLGLAGMLLALVGTLARWQPLSWIALAVVVIALLRAFSKNTAARQKENDSFIAFASRIPGLRSFVASMGGGAATSGPRATGTASGAAARANFERTKRTAQKMWRERKTTRFLKCPNCGQMLSVPKGKGKIRVTCPKCHAKMETKS